MLYLAQVRIKDAGGKTALCLLALQKSEQIWKVLPEPETIPLSEACNLNDGVLVLATLTSTRQVKAIEEAAPWVLEIIKQYLTSGITPNLLEQEVQRAEQWRQSLTLQSQELGRRALETEARRDQIQALEENLKLEKKQLELLATEIEARREQLFEMEENLKREKKQIEILAAELRANIKHSAS
jgi:hypothetical protein